MMGKHRRHTNLIPTEDLLFTVYATQRASVKLYDCEFVNMPLYVFLCTAFFERHPAVDGLYQIGIDRRAIRRNCQLLMPRDVTDLEDGFHKDFIKVRREAIKLAEGMRERVFDIGHYMLAAMRETEVFHGADDSTIRRYKAEYCKAERINELGGGRRGLLVEQPDRSLEEKIIHGLADVLDEDGWDEVEQTRAGGDIREHLQPVMNQQHT